MLQDSHQTNVASGNGTRPELLLSPQVVSTEMLFLLLKQLQANQERTDRLLERLVDDRMSESKPSVPRYCEANLSFNTRGLPSFSDEIVDSDLSITSAPQSAQTRLSC